MDFDFSETDATFRTELREYLARELPPDWQGIFVEDAAAQRFSRDFCRSLGERGWLTMSWPTQWGGSDASAWRQVVLQEELWAHNEPRGAQYMNVNWIGPSIIHFGTPSQQAAFLPRIARGEMVWAQAFSEPDAGSDLASLRCQAEPNHDGFVVNGQKIWISYADFADYCFLLARTDPKATTRSGLSVLLVDLTLPGIEVRPIASALGAHRQNEVRFEDVHVPGDALLGPLHDGWRVARIALAFERSGSARYARSARILGLLEHAVEGSWPRELRARFAELLAMGRVAELANYRVVALKEEGAVPRWEASAARIHNALLEQAIASFAEDAAPMVALGAHTDDSAQASDEVEGFCRNAAAATITAGTYEVQMGIVAREALGLRGER